MSANADIGIASGWVSTIDPRPPHELTTGEPRCSATACSSALAWAWMTPVPAWMSGRFAACSITAARRTSSGSAGSGVTRRYVCGGRTSDSATAGLEFIRFSGMSTWTTPGRPLHDTRNARRIISPIRSIEGAA